MEQPKKLIEVAMPIKEISAESVRDKSIRHGHISTLHLWWARRPLAVCRAVVFASLIPDPLDEKCPKSFRDAVIKLLSKENNIGDPYKPYDDIPYTSAIDKMEDNPRNRLLMFIGKFSDRYISNERKGLKTDAKDQLNDFCLIKWDTIHNEEIINKARKLIWVAYNAKTGLDSNVLLNQFDKYFNSVKDAENDLYNSVNRHINTKEIDIKENRLKVSIDAFMSKMPKIFDPFAGGAAIPLEAARLGCRSFGNDINPVAHIIEKVSAEFPQKYGKSIIYSKEEFIHLYGQNQFTKLDSKNIIYENGAPTKVLINNRLAYDVEYYGNALIKELEKKVKHYYTNSNNQPIGFLWAHRAKCKNPTCGAKVPLIGNFTLCSKESKKFYLNPIITNNVLDFDIKSKPSTFNPFVKNKNLHCPFCGNVTNSDDLKEQFRDKTTDEIIYCVIDEGKVYRTPNKFEINYINKIEEVPIPNEEIVKNDSKSLWITLWGIEKWGEIYNQRQLLSIYSLIDSLKEILEPMLFDRAYKLALETYLAVLINRVASRLTKCSFWNSTAETLEIPFGNKTVPFVFDFMESNPLSDETGGARNQLMWIVKYIENESENPFISNFINSSSGDKLQFEEKEINTVITDPPYYNSIGYSDLSDLFYVWFKRTLSKSYPFLFTTPLTPKSDECTAMPHHHGGDKQLANRHFEVKLTEIFTAVEKQTEELVSIMFAHQSTEAWTTLCNSILGSNMNISGSWAIDTERTSGTKTDKSFLASSVTVSAKPVKKAGLGLYKTIKNSIEDKISVEVEKLYHLGFRGADLLTACFGQAVSVFGQYESVEKADGSQVTVAELLEMAKESAFNALLKGFAGDDFTKFYIGWLQLFGFSESDFDDAAKFARVGLTINVSDLFAHNLFIKKGSKQELAGYKERLKLNHRIGEGSHSFIIDFVHKAMALYEGANRNALLAYIAKVAASPDNSFWRVITSLCEILPQGSDDYKQASGLLLNKDSLIRESKNIQLSAGEQGQLF